MPMRTCMQRGAEPKKGVEGASQIIKIAIKHHRHGGGCPKIRELYQQVRF